MKILTGLSATLGVLLVVVGQGFEDKPAARVVAEALLSAPTVHAGVTPAAASATNTELIQQYCVSCHSDRRLTGNLSLENFDAEAPEAVAELTEKMIRKLRAEMMPPPGSRRPAGDSLVALVESLEALLDAAAADNPNPGGRTFQRLNRAEYSQSIHDLLLLDIDAADYLPLDTKSANFDNIADVQMLSPMLLDTYFRAAAEISRLAAGNANALPASKTYTNSGYVTQWDRIEGAPFGTRGGISVDHTFIADGEYVFKMAFEHTTTGGFFGGVSRDERIEVSIDGERVALQFVDKYMSVSDPNGVNMQTEPIFVRAGPHRVSAAFLRQAEGPKEDLVSPHDWSLTDRQIGVSGYGVTSLAHLKDLVVAGPYNPTGVSETPSRAHIFSCRPLLAGEAPDCAADILTRLGSQAFRRPLTDDDLSGLMTFYELGAESGGFETGVRTAIEAMLASPDFVFRFEEAPAGVGAGESYRINDFDLASRLSFFLWGSPPDASLIDAAGRGELSSPDALEAQVRRMLADPRAAALGTRFASQWLRLEDLEKVHPDRLLFPDFHQQLADAMLRETALFFNGLVREDRSVLDLFTADYTYLNETLAEHYGIPGVMGDEFREVAYPEDAGRRGLLGHGSILTLTSHAGRTSPVLRGKWVMEVLLGIPPPPPPPGVPDLDETEASEDGVMLTTRERMEIHRTSPSCNSCHRLMDPIGLALDNFDVTGRWRIRENGMPLDTQGELYDGTPITTPIELADALAMRPIPLVRTFTENLMAYALGRRVEYFDQPTVRAITAQAEADDFRISSFILGVVNSDAFQMQRVYAATDDTAGNQQR
jgi:mono/diheme cytochrome c family protein